MKEISTHTQVTWNALIKKYSDSGDAVRVNALKVYNCEYDDSLLQNMNCKVLQKITKGLPENKLYYYLTNNVEHWMLLGNHPFGETCTRFNIKSFSFRHEGDYSRIVPFYIADDNTNIMLVFSKDVTGLSVGEAQKFVVARAIITKVDDKFIIHRIYCASQYTKQSILDGIIEYFGTTETYSFQRLRSDIVYRGYADIFKYDDIDYYIIANEEVSETGNVLNSFIEQTKVVWEPLYNAEIDGSYVRDYELLAIAQMTPDSYIGNALLPIDFYTHIIEVDKNNNFLKEDFKYALECKEH